MTDPSPTSDDAAPRARKTINLALQGGGSHGAYTWGVLDRLLEADCFDFEGVVGTSAGAMNAALLTYGLKTGGPAHARELMRAYWERMMKTATFAPWPSFLDRMMGDDNMSNSPAFTISDAMTRIFSPYQMNPTGFNPIEPIINDLIDFEALQRIDADPQLFLCATNVRTSRAKVFQREELTADAVLASACLPFMNQAVEIDGEYYWDGGYMGNPPLYPIFYHCECRDLLIVQIIPVNIDSVPTTASEIFDRITSLSFNSSLMREMRVVNFITELLRDGYDDGGRLREVFIHTIDAEETMKHLSAASQANLDRAYIQRLFELGREKADQFIAQHFDQVGVESSTDIREKFM